MRTAKGITVTEDDFVKEMMSYYPKQYTISGLYAIFDWIHKWETVMEWEIELIPSEIIDTFSQYKNIEEFNDNTGEEYNSIDEMEEYEDIIELEGGAFISYKSFIWLKKYQEKGER